METLLVFSLTLTLNGQQVGSASHWDTLDDCRHAARQLVPAHAPKLLAPQPRRARGDVRSGGF